MAEPHANTGPSNNSTDDNPNEDLIIIDNNSTDDNPNEDLIKTKDHKAEKCEVCLFKQNEDPEPLEEIKFNTTFCCEYSVRRSMIMFCDKFHHAFQVKSTERDNPEKGTRAKIVYKCTHVVDRSKQPKRPAAKIRTAQYHNYT